VRLQYVIWKDQFVGKIAAKHGVRTEEVEDVLFSSALVRKIQKGRIKGEHVYVAYGQTGSGRHLVVFFIYKRNNCALPISARDMTRAERNYYNDHKEKS